MDERLRFVARMLEGEKMAVHDKFDLLLGHLFSRQRMRQEPLLFCFDGAGEDFRRRMACDKRIDQ